MGIPKFYRWLSERYPLVNQTIGSSTLPEFDNLYLDMNGIIHNCTHGNDPSMKLTEDEMFVKVFVYLERLFDIVKPQKLLFMAVDGVAPRAKMNQQRARRFKTKKAAIEAAEEAIRRGEPPPETEPFDSNCITPGTDFMAALTNHLRFFIRKKLAEDPDWQKPAIVLSGPDVPGEGEHKIMEYIRWQKRQPDFDGNERHCMYGLDADLIMLSLVTHEPHFCLLREVVSYTGGNQGRPIRDVLDNPCKEHFILFQIELLREYLDAEFYCEEIKDVYDVERVVDDVVLFCMLVGNDFLPPLPTLDIGEGGLDKLIAAYKELLPKWQGFLTYAGELSHGRLEDLLGRLAGMEAEVLQARAEDAEYFESKRASKRGRGGDDVYTPPAFREGGADAEIDENEALDAGISTLALEDRKELEILAVAEGEMPDDRPAGPAEPTMMSAEARALFLNGDSAQAVKLWRERYYREKLGVGQPGAVSVRGVVQHYVEGLHWVLEYYYRGVASWTWFYPHHYAPLASDCSALTELAITFERGEPFLPFEQLLGVLPSASSQLLPAPYRPLMTDASSPIIDFYPTNFGVDLEGKRADWEGVVLIPFIDERRLLAAARSVSPNGLTKEERERNKLGQVAVFRFKEGASERKHCQSTLPQHYGNVAKANSVLTLQPPPPPLPDSERGFVPKLHKDCKPGSQPGFATLSSLKNWCVEVRLAGINVFGNASKKESCVLRVQDVRTMLGGQLPLEKVADTILGEKAWIKWPYLQEALVQAVSDEQRIMPRDAAPRPHGREEARQWQATAAQLGRDLLTKEGIDAGTVDLLVHCRPLEGLIRQVDGSIEKRYGKKEVLYPLQLTLRRCPVVDDRLDPAKVGQKLLNYDFKEGMRVLWLGRSNYGCVATVLPPPSLGLNKKGQKIIAPPGLAMLRVEVSPAPPTVVMLQQAAKRILLNTHERYTPSNHVARRLGMSSRSLGRMTGNLWIIGPDGRVDVGICVKVATKGLSVPDLTRPSPDGKGWEHSDSLIRVLEQYKTQFPWVVAALEADPEATAYELATVLPSMSPDAARAELARLQGWLKKLPATRKPLVKSTVVLAPEVAVKTFQAAMPPPFTKRMPGVEVENVHPCFLLPPAERGGLTTVLAGGGFDVGDRVVSLRAGDEPPFGSRGTVVGVYDDACEVLFDDEFSGGSNLYGRCDGPRGAIMPAAHLLNVSKPQAVPLSGANAPKVVRSRNAAAAAQPEASKSPFRAKEPGSAGSAANLEELQGANGTRVIPEWAKKAREGGGRGPIKPIPKASFQPRLPDGTKGFSHGRGRVLPASDSPPAPGGMVPHAADGPAPMPGAKSAPMPVPAPRAAPPGFAAPEGSLGSPSPAKSGPPPGFLAQPDASAAAAPAPAAAAPAVPALAPEPAVGAPGLEQVVAEAVQELGGGVGVRAPTPAVADAAAPADAAGGTVAQQPSLPSPFGAVPAPQGAEPQGPRPAGMAAPGAEAQAQQQASQEASYALLLRLQQQAAAQQQAQQQAQAGVGVPQQPTLPPNAAHSLLQQLQSQASATPGLSPALSASSLLSRQGSAVAPRPPVPVNQGGLPPHLQANALLLQQQQQQQAAAQRPPGAALLEQLQRLQQQQQQAAAASQRALPNQNLGQNLLAQLQLQQQQQQQQHAAAQLLRQQQQGQSMQNNAANLLQQLQMQQKVQQLMQQQRQAHAQQQQQQQHESGMTAGMQLLQQLQAHQAQQQAQARSVAAAQAQARSAALPTGLEALGLGARQQPMVHPGQAQRAEEVEAHYRQQQLAYLRQQHVLTQAKLQQQAQQQAQAAAQAQTQVQQQANPLYASNIWQGGGGVPPTKQWAQHDARPAGIPPPQGWPGGQAGSQSSSVTSLQELLRAGQAQQQARPPAPAGLPTAGSGTMSQADLWNLLAQAKRQQ